MTDPYAVSTALTAIKILVVMFCVGIPVLLLAILVVGGICKAINDARQRPPEDED